MSYNEYNSLINKNSKTKAGKAKSAEKKKKLIQPKLAAATPANDDNRLRAIVAKDTKTPYCVAVKATLHKLLR